MVLKPKSKPNLKQLAHAGFPPLSRTPSLAIDTVSSLCGFTPRDLLLNIWVVGASGFQERDPELAPYFTTPKAVEFFH